MRELAAAGRAVADLHDYLLHEEGAHLTISMPCLGRHCTAKSINPGVRRGEDALTIRLVFSIWSRQRVVTSQKSRAANGRLDLVRQPLTAMLYGRSGGY
jgi:hypothetical protein